MDIEITTFHLFPENEKTEKKFCHNGKKNDFLVDYKNVA